MPSYDFLISSPAITVNAQMKNYTTNIAYVKCEGLQSDFPSTQTPEVND